MRARALVPALLVWVSLAGAAGPWGGSAYDVALSPGGAGPAWVATTRGLFRFSGERWERVGFWGTRSVTRVVSRGTVVLAAEHRNGLWRSDDGGSTWARARGLRSRTGTRAREILCLAPDASEPSRIYAGTAGQGAFVSEDDGLSWARLDAGLEGARPPALHVTAILPGAGHRPLLMGTDGAGLLAWEGGRWGQVRGLPQGLRVQGLAAPPGDGARVLLATRGRGLWESTDAGRSWRRVRKGLFGVVDAVGVGPDGTVLAHFAGEGLVVARGGRPRATGRWRSARVRRLAPLASGGWIAALDHDGVWRVGPDGVPAQPVNEGLDATTVLSLAQGPGGLWCGDTNGAFRSADGGATWAPGDAGLPGAAVNVLLRAPGGLYAGTGGRGVYLWDPAAGAWQERSRGLGTWNTIFSMAFGAGALYAGTEGGVVRLPAGGDAWERVPLGLPVRGGWLVAAGGDPPGLIWASGGRSLQRSADGGRTWEAVGPAAAVALAPAGPDAGGGIWVLEPRRLVRFRHGAWAPAQGAGTLPEGEQFTCLAPEAGTVWLGTNRGLWRLGPDGSLVRVWEGAGVRSLLPSPRGVLVGTDGRGVVRVPR